MNIVKPFISFLLVFVSVFSIAQVNPLLKKYAGTYHRLSHSEESPVSTSEMIILSVDGKLSSTYYSMDDNGAISKVAEKRSGTWKASDKLLKITIAGVDASTKEHYSFDEEYRLEEGVFIGDNNKLVKVLVSNPAFLTKYAGSYNLIDLSREINDYTPTITIKADGKCTQSIPSAENTGKPIITAGTWKANDGMIQLSMNENGEERSTEYKLKEGVFTDRQGYELRKVVPPPPPGLYLKKYAGTYSLLVGGQSTDNKYVLNADGTGTWTFKAGQPAVKGTWKGSEGLMQLYFSFEDGGGKGDEMISDYRLQEGVFRAEGGLSLKKVVTTTPVKK